MKEDLEEINPKILALSEYLELEEDEILNITKDSYTHFNYDDDDYLVLTSDEVEWELDSLAEDEVSYLQSRINNDSFDYSYFYKVDEEAVRNSFDINSIGIGDWEEINGYYIFKL